MHVPKTHWIRGGVVACKRDPDACLLTDGNARTVVALARDWPGTVCGKCLSVARVFSMRLSPWMPDPEADHCCMRILEGGDPRRISDRVAFIEKTPRVRVAAWSGDEQTDPAGWQSGPKGSGGGDPQLDRTYGYDPRSRAWCDQELIRLGYVIPADMKTPAPRQETPGPQSKET